MILSFVAVPNIDRKNYTFDERQISVVPQAVVEKISALKNGDDDNLITSSNFFSNSSNCLGQDIDGMEYQQFS